VNRRTPLAVMVLALAVSLFVPAPTTAQTEGGPPPLALTTVATTLEAPIAMANRTGTTDLYVAEREGVVRRLEVGSPLFNESPIPVVDIRAFTDPDGEGGLLGLTFNPAGTKLYLHYTNNAGDTRLVEYRMNATGRRVIGSTRRLVLALDQPASNHNGGTVTFGPDGRLYLALGDGGGSGDPQNNAQNLTRLLGKVLRINPNPSGSQAYTVPATNPFAGAVPGRGEIWLYGVRNPWRISFDTGTGDLYVADVGQSALEEVNALPADGGGVNAGRADNLGWRRMEGDQPFNGASEPANHTGPVFTYDHSGGACSITGGYVYRGDALPALDGTYLFGDFCSGTIGGLVAANGGLTSSDVDLGIEVDDFSLYSFGQDADGEVYVLSSNGTVARIDPA